MLVSPYPEGIWASSKIVEKLRQRSNTTVICLKDSRKCSSGIEMWQHRLSLILQLKRTTLLFSCSEKWTPVLRCYCLLSARKLDGICSLFHDEDTKSIHDSISHNVSYLLSEAEYSGKNGKFNLDNKRKLAEQHGLEDSWYFLPLSLSPNWHMIKRNSRGFGYQATMSFLPRDDRRMTETATKCF